MCSRIFYSVAEIRVRDDKSEKGREAKHWIYGRTRLNIIIYSWGVVEKGGGGWAEMSLGGVLCNDLCGEGGSSGDAMLSDSGHLGTGVL